MATSVERADSVLLGLIDDPAMTNARKERLIKRVITPETWDSLGTNEARANMFIDILIDLVKHEMRKRDIEKINRDAMAQLDTDLDTDFPKA